ncbi:MAG TPA: class I SAM-dependent methyltransferase [Gemmatimonadales bacterium]|nr:class I SAM-dependent methyltransferase [Gemmatimonadales bacterium]
MTTFVRADGRPLRVVPGFRERVLGYRPSVTPRPEWTPDQYERAAEKKLERARRLVAEIGQRQELDRGTVLDVGCGDGINCLVMAYVAHARVVGVDLRQPGFERLAELVVARLDGGRLFTDVIAGLPVRFSRADATSLPFPPDSFDVLFSRSALEHIAPVGRALAEMARVTRAGGVIHHAVDPYYWLRGCHKRGLVDIPWAHARLSLDDFRRFVTEREGAAVAAQRCDRLRTLNRLTLAEWREAIEAGPFDILEWTEAPSPFAVQLLEENPDVLDSLAVGVEPRDLVNGRLEFWLHVRKS